jgi:UDP-glucose 4-epimerase
LDVARIKYLASMSLILVTGGAGFVGSHLCKRLVEDGHRVISLDNYFTGVTENHCAGVVYRQGHTKEIDALIPETPDIVYHLGEYSRVEKSFEDPTELVWDLNVAGTFAVLQFCRRTGAKLVYAGSSTKFADGGDGRNQSPYAWIKATNSELVKNYGTWFGLKYAIAYFYNVYGEGEISTGPYSTVIGIFKREYERGVPITVTSPGTQTRCFTHVSDIVNGLVLIGEKGEGDGYDIGNEKAYSILDVAHLFSENIVMLPERQGNRQQSSIDNAKLRALGWEPKTSLEGHIRAFLGTAMVGTQAEKRVLVFSTTFYPVEGPAERALIDVIRAMPDVHFDIITAAHDPSASSVPLPLPNITVHRIGRGTPFDKYRLMFEGTRKAAELATQHRYLFSWSLMASYAAFAGARFRRTTHNAQLPLLITLADHRIDELSFPFRFIVKFILTSGDLVSSLNTHQEHSAELLDPRLKQTKFNRRGDAFVNQVRFLYNALLKKHVA